jgi:long-chain acyl-CoA synthetase
MASWTASFAVNAQAFDIGPGCRVAVLGGLVQSLALYGALEAVHLGAEVHLLDALRPDRQRAALAARRVAVLYATPAQLRLMVEHGGPDLADLRVIVVGGSKLDSALRAALATMTGAAVREFYGAAEASFITLAGPDAPADSVGAPYPGVQIAVRGGAVWVKSPYLFDRYAGADPGGAVWDQGWLSVGEIGRLEAGYLHLSGRAGRMVTVADQNVFPEEIEAFIATLPGVARVAVLPRPDALRGVVLVAVILGESAQEAAILGAGRAAFGPLKAPRAVIWRSDWPVLAAGKTDLRALEASLWP